MNYTFNKSYLFLVYIIFLILNFECSFTNEWKTPSFNFLRKKKITKYRLRLYSKNISINDVCILSGVRTPIGSFKGKLSSLTAVELVSKLLSVAVEKASIDGNKVQEMVLGNTISTGCGQSIGCHAATCAGLPDSIIHTTVNKLCGSGMKAIMNGCQLISTNTQELVVVGGVESISNIPYILKRRQKPHGNQLLKDCLLYDGLLDPFLRIDVTNFAEETVKEYNYTREELDSYALESYSRAENAQKRNAFSSEIVPINVKKKSGEEVVAEDEEVKKLKIDKFRSLKPEMGKGGAITAGNTSSLGDGAAILILASGAYVAKKNLQPIAKVISYADGSVNRKKFVIAPVTAIRKALERANLEVSKIDLWEISETFALTTLLNARLLNINIRKVNVNGGTISLGHPFGMTGARIVIHLAHKLQSGKLGCASISHATGGASAMIIEKL